MPQVLVIDNDPNCTKILESIIFKLSKRNTDFIFFTEAKEALEWLEKYNPDVILLDMELPNVKVTKLFQSIRTHHPKIPIILITKHYNAQKIIEAMRAGAFDYIRKPFSKRGLVIVLEKALSINQTIKGIIPKTKSWGEAPIKIVGENPEMIEIFKTVGQISGSDVSVLLLGENGTGKEMLAHIIHHNSPRRDNPLIIINCAAIPEHLLESEIFGYEQGAFTGAKQRKVGKFELANGGTFFLDEIGDMSLIIQSKLLRVIQYGEFERIGGTETIKADVRIIAATNKNSTQKIREKTFRTDLYYRLKVVSISLPPLRERKDDIPLLIDHFIEKLNEKYNNKKSISSDALGMIMAYNWPGNIRQLQSSLEQAYLIAKGDFLLPDDLPADVQEVEDEIEKLFAQSLTPKVNMNIIEINIEELLKIDFQKSEKPLFHILNAEVELAKELLIKHIWDKTDGKIKQSCQILGISINTLKSYLEKYGLRGK